MDAKCTYIIGFDIYGNDELRNSFVQKLEDEFNAQRINQSCYKVDSTKNVSEMQNFLHRICKDCSDDFGHFCSDDFVKLYCSAYKVDYKTKYKSEIYEYNINLQ